MNRHSPSSSTDSQHYRELTSVPARDNVTAVPAALPSDHVHMRTAKVVYWLGGFEGSGTSMVFGGVNGGGPSPGSGLSNCAVSFLSLCLSGIKGSKPKSVMRRRSSFP